MTDQLQRARSEVDARRVVLDGVVVDYRLIRARRRSIGLAIDLSGLTVRAPRYAPLREIDAVLAARAGWVVETLARWRARQREVMPRAWVSGASILVAGQQLTLEIRPARERSIATDLFNCRVRHPSAGDAREVGRYVEGWLRDEVERRFAPLARELARSLAAAPPEVKISSARHAWGSCTHAGVIRLNRRLIQLPHDLARYVVAHEVAHLAEMNHSPRFWALVESLHPGHKAARRALDDWVALLEA